MTEEFSSRNDVIKDNIGVTSSPKELIYKRAFSLTLRSGHAESGDSYQVIEIKQR